MRIIKFICAAVFCGAFPLLSAQSIRVDSATASPASGGWYPWYEIHADPENANNMILCGARWDAHDDAQYGFVYFSADGGTSWHSGLEDKHSTWVSEESCAFGIHGLAYYVADASKVDEKGALHHDLGSAYIYSSKDAGRTWSAPVKTGWTDYSASVVEASPGSNQNRLYVFFNNLETFYRSIGNRNAIDSLPHGGNSIGLVSYKDGDTKVDGPIFNPDMAAMAFHGSYPAPALMLKDGTFLTFFTSHRYLDPDGKPHLPATEKTPQVENLIASTHYNPNSSAPELPITVASDTPKPGNAEEKCGLILTSAAAYDPLKNIIYFAYELGDDKSCYLVLTTSNDEGRTWKPARRIHLPDQPLDAHYENPALGVNKAGVLGLMWQEGRTGCWDFAASMTGDQNFSVSKQLNDCTSPGKDIQAVTDAYFWTIPFQAEEKNPNDFSRIVIRNMKHAVWRDSHAIAVTPDGVFHPVWIDAGDGRGEIRTAAVTVASVEQLAAPEISGLTPVSNKVAILYGGAQHYDEKTGTLTLSVTFRNNGDAPIRGPFKLEATSVRSAYLNIEAVSSVNHATGGGAVWDVTTSIPGGALAPGATSEPYTLMFHSTPKEHFTIGDILSLDTKLYAKP